MFASKTFYCRKTIYALHVYVKISQAQSEKLLFDFLLASYPDMAAFSCPALRIYNLRELRTVVFKTKQYL